MRGIKLVLNFWLDFFAAYYQRLMRHSKYETPLSIVLHTSFIQSVNFVTILVFIIYLFFTDFRLNFYYFILPMILIGGINLYLFYCKTDGIQRKNLLNRKSKFNVAVYSLYSIISTVLLVIVLYISSKG